ncbi:MAG: PilZ domain-containing protein [Candidatus Acidiferrum sp.]
MNLERRLASRYIKRVPMQFTLTTESSAESYSAESMNISKRGTYFATSLKLHEGVKLELRMKIPEEIESLPSIECKFVGRVTHVEPLGNNGLSGVGVHFLYYSVD